MHTGRSVRGLDMVHFIKFCSEQNLTCQNANIRTRHICINAGLSLGINDLSLDEC